MKLRLGEFGQFVGVDGDGFLVVEDEVDLFDGGGHHADEVV